MIDTSKIKKFSEQAFYARIQTAGPKECWNWTGSVNSHGYGAVSMNGQHWKAHRLAWVLALGPIPQGRFVCHSCDNRRCCNPDHLWLGTNEQNLADMDRKGRRVIHHSLKKSCPRGHRYSEENTRVENGRKRHCKTCEKARDLGRAR